jgi:hypothetical protein
MKKAVGIGSAQLMRRDYIVSRRQVGTSLRPPGARVTGAADHCHRCCPKPVVFEQTSGKRVHPSSSTVQLVLHWG